MANCFWCGADVDDADWDYLGDRRVHICDQQTCHHELREENAAAEEEAVEAVRDSFRQW